MKSNFDIEMLVEHYGFPLYLYDKNLLKVKIEQVKGNFSGWNILYSMKANPFAGIVKVMKENGVLIDAASRGEVREAENLNFAPSAIYYSSPGKSVQDIKGAIDSCTIIADSVNEIFQINKIAEQMDRMIEIGLRLNIANHLISSNAFEVMGGVESKFGVSMEELISRMDALLALKFIRITGIHIYFGSQVLEEAVIVNNFALIAKAALQLSRHMELRFVNFGGGFGVPYTKEERPLDLCKIKRALDEMAEIQELKKMDVICNLELGRFLAAECGTYVTKVMDMKVSGTKKYAILYGGMNSFFRPVFTKEYHHIYKFHKAGEEVGDEKEQITIAGSLCTPLDQYYDGIEMEPLQIGDLIIFENAGAYGYSMSMLDFISYRKPAQLLIGDIEDEFN